MNKRVAKLREQSVQARPTMSSERAELMTAFYQSGAALRESVPVCRAMAFKHVMENKTICINEGELIVGEKGPAPKATPTYPELCCHSIEDLQILDSREKVSFGVSKEVERTYKEKIIPFWSGKTMRDKIFQAMNEAWHRAYEAGMFTEFMEQRSPGHTTLDDKIYRKGMLDFKQDIQTHLDRLDYLNDPQAYAKQEELKAMMICADALICFGRRHAEKARELAATESDSERKAELERIAEVCSHVPAQAPRNFWEALQYYWFVHLAVTTEVNPWDSFNPGRLDQHLYPFYKKGIEDGTLTPEKAKELLQCFWVKFNNQPAPPKVGVTAAESGTYTDFAQINSGGLKEDGSDGVNDVTYIVLDVVEEMRLVQPSSSIQVSKKNPDRFVKRAARVIRTGMGQPSVFNTDVIIQEMIRVGKSVADARNGGSSGCVEIGAFGKESYILTGYLNIPKVLELTLNNGVDPRSGKQVGLATGDPLQFGSYEQLFEAFSRQLNYLIDIKMRGNNIIERLYATYVPVPFLSILIDDCIAKGRDYHDGGARYNTNYIQGVGLGTISDALAAIKYHVFDRKTFPMEKLLAAMKANFDGCEEVQHTLLQRTPKYGNDDDYADDIMRSVFELYFQGVDGRPNTKGGRYSINLLPTTVHVYFGSVMGATPDGRKAGVPLSEGISPVQGSDHNGPTAVLKSAAKMDHSRTGGTLLNMKFNPQVLDGDDALDKLVQLIRTYFRLDGHHIQFNVVDAATLREAQKHPQQNRDLIVRVAGYSDYFTDLGPSLQEEIIARTEQKSF
jgi:trans-4-hydroxy-L-proline dehydratase